MRQSCIKCHNTHPQTPKSDWELGDVRGVLEVILPVGTKESDVQRQLIGTFLLMILLFGVGAAMLVSVMSKLKQRTKDEKTRADELKEANSVLKQALRSNKELEDFSYVVSHDLKAPLRGVSSLSSWIVTDYADKIDDEGKKKLKLLEMKVKRMDQLINGILEYSRVGRDQQAFEKVDLNETVKLAIEMISAPDHISVKIENALPTVDCHKVRIAQVFQNLISNAVKYMDKDQGEVRVGCVDEDKEFYKFSIADNGQGMEEKYFEKIFNLFQTLQSRDDSDSTGIGLSLVNRIIGLHGGKVWVESRVGEGSVFYFTLSKNN